MFQGDEWQRNQDFIEDLHPIANSMGQTIAQLVVHWTIRQPGITAALCGAKRDYQIVETAGAMSRQLSDEALSQIEAALARRGVPMVRGAI